MPTRLLSSCASHFELAGRVSVLDPCAGDGEALERLCEALGDRAIPLACELEAERAEALRARGRSWEVRPLEGDAMLLRTRAQILFLNPPYDSDPNYGRLEHRFLSRLTRECLEVGGGLIFVIPSSAIRACARFLAEHYDELCCRRFPDPEFADFRQVVIFGRRREPVPGADTARIRDWTTKTDRLPILGRAETPMRISGSPWRLVPRFELDVFDLELLCEQASGSMTHADEPLPDLDELIGGTFGTAVPPKPAHIALAISSGMLNGHEIEPDDPRRHPPMLVKGTLSRRFVEIDRRTNSDGEVTGVVEVQRPNLSVQCLDLRRYRYFQLLEGVEPNGGDDPERWTLADLMVFYGRGLTRLLARQFPALHDPSRDDHRLPLPDLARRPYRAQRTAVEACLKLIARGENPFVVAEVGTGKSTIALYLTAALRPEFRSTLGPALERQGLPADPSEPLDRELSAEYARLQTLLLERIREDRWIPDRAGRLIGQLVELPSYLDRASRELGPFELRYPESLGGETLGRGQDFPDDYLSPKERRLLELLRERRAAGERILIFLRHTRGALPRRLRRLIDEQLGERSVFLDASKVSTRKRQEWIERKVVRPDVPILLVNPNAVRTGLNNLVGFSTAVWFEVDPSASTYRQANGRLHRIGQTRPVTVVSLVYRGTAQEVLLDLVAKKVSTSLQVDGLDVQAALEAAGVGSDDALELALSIGQAVYRRLVA